MKRVLFSAAILATLFAAAPSQARPQGRWCANFNYGYDGLESDCSFNSIEECRPAIFGGSRGFCTPNPRFVEPPVPLRRRHPIYR
jgi:hypothetical protein